MTVPQVKGLCQFLDERQAQAWLEGEAEPVDSCERPESLEQRFRYVARFEKLLRRSQSGEVLAILKLYANQCLPIPRTTERYYWSVSCLPSTSDKPFARISASWMELFTLLPDGDGIRARFILHPSDFTTDRSSDLETLDQTFLHECVDRPEDVSHFAWNADTFGVKVRGASSIRRFIGTERALRAIRRFNLTHLNRGRNAYQASHCFSLADAMLDD